MSTTKTDLAGKALSVLTNPNQWYTLLSGIIALAAFDAGSIVGWKFPKEYFWEAMAVSAIFAAIGNLIAYLHYKEVGARRKRKRPSYVTASQETRALIDSLCVGDEWVKLDDIVASRTNETDLETRLRIDVATLLGEIMRNVDDNGVHWIKPRKE